jgi:hypothetical protein
MRKPKICPNCNLRTKDSELVVKNTMYKDKKDWFCIQCSHFFNCAENDLYSWYDDIDFDSEYISPIKIADIIYDDWENNISTFALPYVEALSNLNDYDDSIGYDSANIIIGYFLNNSKSWK